MHMVRFNPSYASLLALFVIGFSQASLLDDILDDIENAVDCDSCLALLIPVKALAYLGDDIFLATFTTICTDLGVEDADVCAGVVQTQGPILAHDIKSISTSGRTATSLCNALIGLCQPPTVAPYTVPFPKPSPPANATKIKSSGNPPIQVIHFSDVHIDHQYTVGANANCTKPICCRNYADETGPVTEPAGPNGNYHCDSPVTLAASLLEAFQEFAPTAVFSIFTGDVTERDIWAVNQSVVTSDLNDFNAQMAAALQAPVYGSIGNHDVAPANDFPRNTSTSAPSVEWAFELQSEGWERWIQSTAAAQMLHTSGSYSILVPGQNLMIISLNTIYWYKDNVWLFDSDTLQPDPNGILAFLVQELQAAEDAGQRAWIIGHLPLGDSDALNDQSNYYDQVTQRYKDTIAGHFFGHTHHDEFEIGYSDYNNRNFTTADSVAMICPALTPTSGNPAFKAYDIDPDTYEIVDVKVYIANLSDPSFQTQASWELYYSVRDTYAPLVGTLGATDALTPAFWHNLTEVFEADNDAFQTYNTFLTRGVNVSSCDESCANTTICGMRALRAEDNCYVASFGVPFNKREEDGAQIVEAVLSRNARSCEHTSIGHLFKKMVGQPVRQKLSSATRARLEQSFQ